MSIELELSKLTQELMNCNYTLHKLDLYKTKKNLKLKIYKIKAKIAKQNRINKKNIK